MEKGMISLQFRYLCFWSSSSRLCFGCKVKNYHFLSTMEKLVNITLCHEAHLQEGNLVCHNITKFGEL